MRSLTYDIVVIGAGSGGLTAAVGFAKVGKKVLLIEKEHMGGECTNSGCIPSKALLHHAKTYHQATTIAGESTKTEAYRTGAFAHVRGIVDSILKEETPAVFAEMGIDVVMGEAVFHDRCAVRVGDITYTYKKAVIATGSSPWMIDVEGFADEQVLTNQSIFDLTEIPKRLLVIGSGPIGMEMGQAFAMLGSDVTIASIDSEFARLEDPAIRPILKKSFEALGITIELNAHISEAASSTATFTRTDDDSNTETFAVSYDKILVAIGRVPNFPSGLDAAGIEHDERGICVDSQHRTSNRFVYAVGDVAQRLKFTHTADDIARGIVTREATHGLVRLDTRRSVPKVTYTLPEVAQVGLSYDAAKEKYRAEELMRIEVPFSQNDRAKTDSETDGLLIVIVRRLNGSVLGAHIVGPAAGELISIFTLAIEQKISMWSLRKVIYAYPTYSLIVKKAGDRFFATQINDLKADTLHLVKKHSPKIFAALFWGTLFYLFHTYRVENELSYQDVTIFILEFFTGTMYGPLAYMALYAIRPLIFFPATLLTALSGALFGFWWGVIYTIIGENASANLAYWIGRFFGKDLRLEDSFIGNWVTALRKRPFEAVLFMRLFYFPFDFTNYGSGILRVKWSQYFLATLIGIMPGLTTFVALGAAVDLEAFQSDGLSFDVFEPKFIALSLGIFIVSLILSKVLRRWKADTT